LISSSKRSAVSTTAPIVASSSSGATKPPSRLWLNQIAPFSTSRAKAPNTKSRFLARSQRVSSAVTGTPMFVIANTRTTVEPFSSQVGTTNVRALSMPTT
jgi:hypothetical protein